MLMGLEQQVIEEKTVGRCRWNEAEGGTSDLTSCATATGRTRSRARSSNNDSPALDVLLRNANAHLNVRAHERHRVVVDCAGAGP